MKIFEITQELFRNYKGKVIIEEDKVKIISNNMLEDKKVECEVSVGLLKSEKYPYAVDASEKTFSIIGGCGMPCENEDEAIKDAESMLKRYNFEKKKGHEQLSLFSL